MISNINYSICIMILAVLYYCCADYYGPSINCDDCYGCMNSPCYDHSLQTTIKFLWAIPKDINENAQDLRCAIVSMLDGADKRRLAFLLSLSVYCVNYLSGVLSLEDATCIYGELVNQTVISQLSNDECSNASLKEANQNYGRMRIIGVNVAVYHSLFLAGCPVKPPKVNSKNVCGIGTSPSLLTSIPNTDIPESIVSVLSTLAESEEDDDRALAAIAYGSGTKSSVDAFEEILDNESLVKMEQLKGCPIVINKNCCSARKKELDRLAKDLHNFINNEYDI